MLNAAIASSRVVAYPRSAVLCGKRAVIVQNLRQSIDGSKWNEQSICIFTSEIVQLEARYDGIFPTDIYAMLEDMKRKLAVLHKAL